MKAPAAKSLSPRGTDHNQNRLDVTTTHTTAPTTTQACFLEWCDGTARYDGLCGHHHALEVKAAAYAKRELYAALADYYQEDTTWHDANPPDLRPDPTPAIRAVTRNVWRHPDGSDYGIKALQGMVGDLAALTGDGRSDALMRLAYRAGRLVVEGHLNEHVVIRVVDQCVDALYPTGEMGKRARARRRAMDSVADGIRKQAA